MAMDATLSQLRAFHAVAEELNFGRAAARLGIAQPTISKEVRRLEQAVGAPLFARSAGGTTLTRAGEVLRPHAAAVLEQAERFGAAARAAAREARRVVRVAASPSIVNRLLPEILRAVDDHDLGVSMEVLEVETGEVLAAVETGRADLGIGHLIGEPGRAVTRDLGRDEIRVLLHRALVPGGVPHVDLRRLANVPLLLWPRERSPIYYDFLLDACRSRGLEPLVLMGTSRISGSWSYFLQDARAFALVPADFAQQEARGVLVSLPLDPALHIPLQAAWSRNPPDDVALILTVLGDLTRDRPVAGTD